MMKRLCIAIALAVVTVARADLTNTNFTASAHAVMADTNGVVFSPTNFAEANNLMKADGSITGSGFIVTGAMEAGTVKSSEMTVEAFTEPTVYFVESSGPYTNYIRFAEQSVYIIAGDGSTLFSIASGAIIVPSGKPISIGGSLTNVLLTTNGFVPPERLATNHATASDGQLLVKSGDRFELVGQYTNLSAAKLGGLPSAAYVAVTAWQSSPTYTNTLQMWNGSFPTNSSAAGDARMIAIATQAVSTNVEFAINPKGTQWMFGAYSLRP